MSEAERTEGQGEGSLLSHLVELRTRLLKMVVAVLVIFICLVPFADTIFTLAATPLMARLPEGTSMIATQVASPFLTPFKLALAVAVFLAMPILLYQAWAFVAPGLYKHERRLVVPLMTSSIVLFYSGVAFAYFVVFPLMFGFFTKVAPSGVTVMTDISAYLDFVLALFFAFGLAFEVPVATVLAVWAGFTTPAKLAQKRPYVLLGAFVLGMLLTPPDVISQTLLAVPVYILFEGGIIMARVMVPGHKEVEAQQKQDSQEGL
ncbi:MAG: twin-arginine translocase subunit TatC [Gammaproteobacteria bacterium]